MTKQSPNVPVGDCFASKEARNDKLFMELKGKSVLVLGATGMAGQAITKALLRENVGTLILTSLFEDEVTAFSENLSQEFKSTLPKMELAWGNFLFRHEWKDLTRQELLSDSKIRQQLILDILEPLNKDILTSSEIYYLCFHYKPDIIIDTINLATALPYQDFLGLAKEALYSIKKSIAENCFSEASIQAIEKLLLSQETPHLIRHMQIFFQSMMEAKTKLYLKIGASGNGSLGFNNPFTHTEDSPSQTLLSKSTLAGAHSLLLFLMTQTPGAPIIKEIKPRAAVAWKQIGFGPITQKGKAILLEEVRLADAVTLAGKLSKNNVKKIKYLKHNNEPKALTAPFINTGENGFIALGEFEILSEKNQLGFVSPEEIAETAIQEIKEGGTGKEIIASLYQTTLGPSHKTDLLREQAIQKAKEIAKKPEIDSVAFDLLGSPRISKLLFEAYLLKKFFGTRGTVLGTEAETISQTIEKKLLENDLLRSQIISVGIPILLSTGSKLLKGSKIAVPADIPGKHDAQFEITDANINRWAFDGWVDLRHENMLAWQTHLQKMGVASNGDVPLEISKMVNSLLSPESF